MLFESASTCKVLGARLRYLGPHRLENLQGPVSLLSSYSCTLQKQRGIRTLEPLPPGNRHHVLPKFCLCWKAELCTWWVFLLPYLYVRILLWQLV